MAASAAQYDVVAGIDISSLSSVTQAQIMQMVNQIMPLGNIGGIIVMDGGGGTDWPGVTNNPRFYRYIWLDTNGGTVPTIKLYDQSGTDGYANWVASTLADLSVTNAKIANNTIQVGKIATTGGSARWIMRINAGGTAVEWQNPNSILADDDVPITSLDDTGAPANDCFLQRVSGTIAWQTHTQAANAIMAAITSFTVSKLSIGSASQILQTVGGIAVWMDILTAIADKLVPLSKLNNSGAGVNQVPRWDGNNWTPHSLPVTNVFTATGIPFPQVAGGLNPPLNHGFNPSYPRFVQWRALMGTNVSGVAHGWSTGDKISLNSFANTANVYNTFSEYETDTVVAVVFSAQASLQVRIKGTGQFIAMTPLQASQDFTLEVVAAV